MKQEIREWARTCIPCQKCKVHRHTKSKFGEYEVPDTRFSVIHIDLIGPLPPSQGMTFCMTCIDRFSCWMEAVPLPDCKAETASKAFYEHWVCRFGVPGKIITDQRRTLKGEIKAPNNIKWTETLPTILLGLRTALRPDTNHTIAQMVYGSNIRLPGEFFNPPSIQIDPETFVTTLQTFMDELKPTKSSPPKSQKIFVHKDLKSCTHVFVRVDRVRKALEPPYDGPFPVKERYEKYFTLTIKNKPVNISVDRLKPAYLLMTDSIPDKTTVPCRQSDENSAANDTKLLPDVKPTVSRHGRLVKKPTGCPYPCTFSKFFKKVIKNKKRPKRKVKIKPEEVLEWTDEATTAFELVKQALAHATLLHHPPRQMHLLAFGLMLQILLSVVH
ncbi:retrovirus-related Pol polyprotein from transposon opus [Trichonephila clavipes]|nr:retrovirus-related Pol polyprotein from transposon opus [Trichonephila clavipes]